MKKVIITGANGFIGTSIVHELSNAGIDTIAVIKDQNEPIEHIINLPGVSIVYCDLENINVLPDIVHDRDIDAFIHLAWAGAASDARADYALQLDNVRCSLNAVNAISRMNIKRFIGAGTLMELDAMAYLPLDGSLPNAVSHYPIAKIATRMMTKTECTRLGIEHIWCQISNNYGPGVRGGFVNYAINCLLSGNKPEFTPGEQLYDFMYVNETAKAFVAAAIRGKSNCTYYLGSSKPRKLKEYIFAIRDAVDPSIQIELGARSFQGVSLTEKEYSCLKLKEDTGYQANVSFEDGIRETVAWMRSQRV